MYCTQIKILLVNLFISGILHISVDIDHLSIYNLVGSDSSFLRLEIPHFQNDVTSSVAK